MKKETEEEEDCEGNRPLGKERRRIQMSPLPSEIEKNVSLIISIIT